LSPGVTRSELRKVRSIVSLIGAENLLKLSNASYQCLRGFHIYVAKSGENQLALSIWDAPREETTSHCLFADRISISAYMAAVDYWRPRVPGNPDAVI
jgi:hypothetical protein